jgi:hypothetical protein
MKQANLSAEILESEIKNRSKTVPKIVLRITNKGLADARDTKVILDDRPLMEYTEIPKNQKEIKHIGRENHIDYILGYGLNVKKPTSISITWSDDSGEPRSWRTGP